MIALALGAALSVISAENAPPSPAAWTCAYVAERLPRSLGLLGDDTVSAEETRAARKRLSLPQGLLTRASNLALARALGAARLVVVRCRDDGSEITIEARDFDAEAPVAGTTRQVSRPRWDLAAAIDEIAIRLASSPSPGPLGGYRAPSPPALAKAGPALALAGAHERARGLVLALREDPTSIDLRLSAVESLIAAGDFETAIQVGNSVAEAEAPPLLARALRFLTGSAQLEAGRYAEAAKTFSALGEERPTAAVLNNLGVARFRLRDQNASALFARAGSLPDPRERDIGFNRCLALIFEGRAESALSLLTRLMEATPGDARARLLRVWALRILDREVERGLEWERLMAEAPSFSLLARPDLARRLERIFLSERGVESGGRSPW